MNTKCKNGTATEFCIKTDEHSICSARTHEVGCPVCDKPFKDGTCKPCDHAIARMPVGIKYGQKLVPPFTLEVFDSRNTSFDRTADFDTMNEGTMRLAAKANSTPFKAILHDSAGHWVEYEKGVLTSWSVTQD